MTQGARKWQFPDRAAPQALHAPSTQYLVDRYVHCLSTGKALLNLDTLNTTGSGATRN